MRTYTEQVFDWIDTFSIFGGSVQDCARGIFVDSQVNNMYPSNAAVCCLNLAYQTFGGDLKDKWGEVLLTFHRSPNRYRKPKYGKKLLINIKRNSDELKALIDLDKHKYITEVIYSGRKIGLLPAAQTQESKA
jgi:hypothetical protein